MDDKAKSTIRQAQLAKYHKALDHNLGDSRALFQQLLSASNINGYWQLWNWAVEESFCEIFVAKEVKSGSREGGTATSSHRMNVS